MPVYISLLKHVIPKTTGSFILLPEPLECSGRVGSLYITYRFMLAGVEWM